MCRPDQCTGACAQQAACGNTPLDMDTGVSQWPPCAVDDPGPTRRTLWLHAETDAAPAASAAEDGSRGGAA